MPDINKELMDLILKRSHYLFMYENSVIKDITEPYHTAKLRLIDKLKTLEDHGEGFTLQHRMDVLKSRIAEIDIILKSSTTDAISYLSYHLNNLAFEEKDYYEKLLMSKMGNIGLDISRIPTEQLAEIVNTPMGGAMYWERMQQRYGDGLWEVKKELTQGIISGEDMAKISRKLVGVGKQLGGVLGERLVDQPAIIARTEIMRVSNEVSRRVYEENEDILKGLQFVATLDMRTCMVCGMKDGVLYNIPVPNAAKPPLHPFCRCLLVPVSKSWKELEGENEGKIKEDTPVGTRASFSGQVPNTLTYKNWLIQMNDNDSDFVKDILGPKKYSSWLNGKLVLKEMAKSSRLLNLEELKQY